jgi:hypothetical protein
MTRRRDLQRLADWVDGRLGKAERRRFEARLAQDPELARRADEWRRLGRDLREALPGDEPSPHLLERVVAASRADRAAGAGAREGRSGSPRVAPRFALGSVAALAAAALLVAAGATWWLGRGETTPALVAQRTSDVERETAAPLPPPIAPRANAPSPVQPERETGAQPVAPAERRAREFADDRVTERADQTEQAEHDEMAHEDVAAAAEPGEQEAAPPPAAELSMARAGAAPSDWLAFARDLERELAARADGSALAPRKAETRTQPAERAEAAAPPADAAAAAPSIGHAVVPLPAGAVAPAELREVASEEDWHAIAGDDADAILRILARHGGGRAVVVGPARTAGCAAIAIEREAAGWRLGLAPGGGTAATAGCAVVLPLDGRPWRAIEHDRPAR